MSGLAAFVTLVVAAIVYVAVNIASRETHHTGRDPVDPVWSLSHWNPNGVHTTKQCSLPSLPGSCIIEGVQQDQARQAATRTCQATTCIGFQGEIVSQGQVVPFSAACNIPFCGWSQCRITFGEGQYVQVIFTAQKTFSIQRTANLDLATKFYMFRQQINDKGLLVGQENGSLAQFFLLPAETTPPSSGTQMLILCYWNTAQVLGTGPRVTALSIQAVGRPQDTFIEIFVLLEALPQSISQAPAVPPASRVVSRKLLLFGGANRGGNPDNNVLAQFSLHQQTAMWKAINAPVNMPMLIMKWQNGGFYAFPEQQEYSTALNNYTNDAALVQDVLETRLIAQSTIDRPFYSWA